MKTMHTPIVPVRPKWNRLVAVCDECDAGKRVRKSLRQALKERGIRGVRVVAASCLDVCPKRGATVAVTAAGEIKTFVVTGEGVDALVISLGV